MPPKRNNEREERITMEIIVDAYGPEEQAMGWYYYLEETIQFPFTAKCKSRRQTSPIKAGEIVEVIGMADESECEREMFVLIRWDDGTLAIPLGQLEPDEPKNDDTVQAVEDWDYWISMGYQF